MEDELKSIKALLTQISEKAKKLQAETEPQEEIDIDFMNVLCGKPERPKRMTREEYFEKWGDGLEVLEQKHMTEDELNQYYEWYAHYYDTNEHQ
jgi:hypothetical protein